MFSDGVSYAIFSESKVTMVASSELLAKFPEALVQFLESVIVFSWPSQRDLIDNNMKNNGAFISACTNQCGKGLKYLLSVDGSQFIRVMTTDFALEHSADLVVAFLESKLDFDDCHKLPNDKCYGNTYFFPLISDLILSNTTISLFFF